VIVSSIAHKWAKFDVDNLNSEKWFRDFQVYHCSKLANILIANELSRKLNGSGTLPSAFNIGLLNFLSPFINTLHAEFL
jgi:hypothetical protein